MASRGKNDRQKKYIYELPYSTLQKLYDILDCDKAWEKLGGEYLKYDMTTLESFNRAVYHGGSPARSMLTRWGNSNGTVDRLFVYLYKIQHFCAMKILLPYVTDKVKHLYLTMETSTRTGMHMTNMGLNSNSNFTGQGWSTTQIPNQRVPECAGLSTMNQSRMHQQSGHYYSHKIKQSSQHMHSKMPVEEYVPPCCTNDSTFNIKENGHHKSKLSSSDERNINHPSSDESMRSKTMSFSSKSKDPEFRHMDDDKNHAKTREKDEALVYNQLSGQSSIKIINREGSYLLEKQENRREIPKKKTSREENSEKVSLKPVNILQKLPPNENTQKEEIQIKRKISDVSSPQSAVLQLTYQEILAATHKFSTKVLGQGGFGTVYSGDWKGTKVAIKFIRRRTNPGQKTNDDEKLEQSLVELKALTSCRHDNILPLYGYSLNEYGLCFVYQFMSNGSLEDRLQCKGNTTPLNWLQRCQITRGAACGIHYLHSLPKPLIHGDIKSANILLDKNFEPKIGDFGLVHEGPGPDKTNTHVFRLCGTPPYLPPEYLGKHQLSTKVDSFSFGVVLFEVATGWKALDEGRAKLNLPKYLVIYIQKMTKDPDFIRDRKAGEENGELFLFFFKLGQKCIEDHKDKRPEMEQILKAIDNQLLYIDAKIKARKKIGQQANGAGKNQQLPHPLFQVNQHDHRSLTTNKAQLDSKEGVRSKENQPRKPLSPVEQTTPISYSSSADIPFKQNNVHLPDTFHPDSLPLSYNEIVQNLDVASPPENMKCPMGIEVKSKQEICHVVSQNKDNQEPTGYLPNITMLGHKFSNENDRQLEGSSLGCHIENLPESGAVNLEKFEMPLLDALNLQDSGNSNPEKAPLQTKENVLFAESQITAQGKSMLDFDAFNISEFQEEFQSKVAL